jgi:hypothetical protein
VSPNIDVHAMHMTTSEYSINRMYLVYFYNSEFEKKHYTSNKYLLMEMVRQRITQDYQLVPDALVKEHTKNERLGDASARHQDSIRFFLSMGHRLQILSYDPSNDTGK